MLGVTLCLALIVGVVVLTNKENDKKASVKQQAETTVVALEHENENQSGDSTGAANTNGTIVIGEAANASGAGEAGVVSDESIVTGFNGRKTLQDVERLYAEHKLVASDLDFWDMYPENTAEYAASFTASEKEEPEAEEETQKEDGTSKNKYSKYDEAAKKEAESDPARDGKHTLITYADGEEEWVLINPYLEQNTYDFSQLSEKNGKMLYYEDGRQSSYLGVDLSKYNEEVDFQLLKESGIDFVMLRLGARGYGSGQIMLDEKFTDYITRAAQAGLHIGVYFYSQAITKEEAIEEANFVIQNLANYKLTYPVAFDMEYVENDTARVEALTREEKTTIAKAFLDTVKDAGYKPMVYGTKEWLIKEIDLTKLTDYDIWLSSQEDAPDYPYQFQMWQYSLKGSINGVTGNADMNISFVDYSVK